MYISIQLLTTNNPTGADTTGASITYLLYSLSLPENARYQARLRAEVSSLSPSADLKELLDLPFLDQCVYETLRLYPPGPGSLQQRATPAGTPTPISVNGHSYLLPPQTIIGCLAYSMGRNSEIYGTDSDAFSPDRWDTSTIDESASRLMKEAWLPFGYGARICIGKKYVQQPQQTHTYCKLITNNKTYL